MWLWEFLFYNAIFNSKIRENPIKLIKKEDKDKYSKEEIEKNEQERFENANIIECIFLPFNRNYHK